MIFSKQIQNSIFGIFNNYLNITIKAYWNKMRYIIKFYKNFRIFRLHLTFYLKDKF